MSKYFRLSYNGIGIYEALKKEIWNTSPNPKKEWESLKKSGSFNWLKVPSIYPENCYSYFTESGYKVFLEKAYPTFIKHLSRNKIETEIFEFNENDINIIYEDEHQIVVKIS